MIEMQKKGTKKAQKRHNSLVVKIRITSAQSSAVNPARTREYSPQRSSDCIDICGL